MAEVAEVAAAVKKAAVVDMVDQAAAVLAVEDLGALKLKGALTTQVNGMPPKKHR